MKQRGYSIIELMVVVALVGILGTAMIGMFLSTLRSGGKANSISRIKVEGDYALSTMERLIRQGRRAVCSEDGFSLTITELPSTSPPNPAPTTTYSLDDSKIKINSRFITSDNVAINTLIFDCIDGGGAVPDTVLIEFEMEAATDSQTKETFNGRVNLRNVST